MRLRAKLALCLVALACVDGVFAQASKAASDQAQMPDRADETSSMRSDQADPLSDFDPAQTDASPWSWTLNLLVFQDHVRGLPGGREVNGLNSRHRFGVHYLAETWSFDAVAEATLANHSNQDDRINFRNERSNAINLDTLAWNWTPSDATRLTIGKHALPVITSPLTWDRDLRPLGLSLSHVIELSQFTRLKSTTGLYRGNHLYDDDSQLLAAQLNLTLNEGGAQNGFIALSYFGFDDLEQATRQGLTRQNRRVGSQLISDYRLLDLQLGLMLPLAGKPLDLRLDMVRNLGADDQNKGLRASAVWGSSLVDKGLELGLSYQNIDRDGVMAAFNGDDWWFHADAKGHMPWIAYGFSDHWSMQLSQFIEERNNVADTVRRTVLELRGRF